MDNTVSISSALYLIGFSEVRPVPAELECFGIQALRASRIQAWFKMIPRAEFDGPQAEMNLANVDWLTPRVLAHDQVVSLLSQRCDFYPASFGTVFSSEASLREMIDNNEFALNGFLRWLGGRREYGIKFVGNIDQAAQILSTRCTASTPVEVRNGKGYLQQKKVLRAQYGNAKNCLIETFQRRFEALRAEFPNTKSRPIRGLNNQVNGEIIVGNLAMLLDENETQVIAQWIQDWNLYECCATGIRLEWTGPWPVYSFAPTLDSNADYSAKAA